jgi:hypothetical protein
MDPILSKPFSKFAAIDFAVWKGNGVPRYSHMIDDALEKENFEKDTFVPAVSFLLNGNIEATSRMCNTVCRFIWILLSFVYRSDLLTKFFSTWLLWTDSFLKKAGWGFSSSIAVYRKAK